MLLGEKVKADLGVRCYLHIFLQLLGGVGCNLKNIWIYNVLYRCY